MDNLILALVIRWLGVKDAFSASCVSSEWRAALSSERDNGDLWKQVCKNSFPLLVSQLENDDNNEMNHRLLALGMWEGTQQPHAATNNEMTYTATLAMDQVFAVVDLYRKQSAQGNNKKRKQMISSWVCPISKSFILKQVLYNDNEDDDEEAIV